MKSLSIPKRTVRRVALALTALGLVGALVACGDDPASNRVKDAGGAAPETPDQSAWDEIVTKAKEEGEVTVFSSSGNTDRYFLEFEKLYPEIDVTVERQPTSDLISRLDQELQVAAPSADVAYTSEEEWFADNGEQKLLAPLQLSPDVATAFADSADLTRYYGPVIRQPWVTAYNTDSAQPVKTMEELVTAAADKKVGVLTATTAPATAHQWMTWEESSPGFLKRLAGLDVTVEASSVPMSQSVAAGELDYAFPLPPGTIQPLVEEGAPVAQVVLEGATGIQYGAGILSASQHPNAAQVFVNWLMGRDGQGYLLEKLGPAAVYQEQGDSMVWDEVTPFETSGRTQEDVDIWLEDEWTSIEP